jgi:hypothetical protein
MTESPWLQDLNGKCRYPKGENRPFIPCCEPTIPGKVYCPCHYKECYTGTYKASKKIRGEVPAVKQIAYRGAQAVSNQVPVEVTT